MFSTTALRRLGALPTTTTTTTTARAFSSTPRAHLARMQVIGRLTADPELVNTATGREMVRFSVASDSGPKDNRVTSYYRVANFDEGPRRDYVLGIGKGTLVFLEADARITRWEDEGKTREGLSLVQRQIEVLSRPRPKEGQEPAAAAAAAGAA